MAEYPTLTKDDLATFTSRPLDSFVDATTTTALGQATLLFKIATGLTVFPDDPDSQQLAKYGILAYADHIILSLPYAKALASPFNSESLGSYSYSKTYARAAAQVQKGEDTGVMWFDLAVNRLSILWQIDNLPETGGIDIFEMDGHLVPSGVEGHLRFLSPEDRSRYDLYTSPDFVISRS